MGKFFRKYSDTFRIKHSLENDGMVLRKEIVTEGIKPKNMFIQVPLFMKAQQHFRSCQQEMGV